MNWRQFLTPVRSVKADEAREMQKENPDLFILDVRQPGEYEEGHIAGASLIPMASLPDKMDSLDKDADTLVYCAIGGRSRVAAQMLAGNGFKKIYNLTGGFKAWNGWTGYGDLEQGLDLFDGLDDLGQAFGVALGMEKALSEFYGDMARKSGDADARELFAKLSDIEKSHFELIEKRAETAGLAEAAQKADSGGAVEGGVSTGDYMARLGVDLGQARDILSFAMSVEAGGLDLYSRAAGKAEGELKEFFRKMMLDERSHIKLLAGLMDRAAAKG